MSHDKRVPRNECLFYKGKYYMPGTVVKINNDWLDKNGNYFMDDYLFTPYASGGLFTFTPQPVRHLNINFKGNCDHVYKDSGKIYVKSSYLVYDGLGNNVYKFKHMGSPYITKDDVYFVSRNTDSDFYTDMYFDSDLDITETITDKNLLPDYVDINHLLQKEIFPSLDGVDNFLSSSNVDFAIDEVIDGKEWSIEENPDIPDKEIFGMSLCWIVYLGFMVLATLFVHRVVLWVIITIMWSIIRQSLVNDASGY